MKTLKILLIGFCAILLSNCADSPERLTINDTLSIKKSISDILNDEYGLFVNKETSISSADDLCNYSLVLIGEIEPNMAENIVILGMEKTDKLLLKEIISIYISPNMGCPDIDNPCVSGSETWLLSEKEIKHEKKIYGKDADMNSIFKKSIASTDCVFLLKKKDSKKYCDKLNVLNFK